MRLKKTHDGLNLQLMESLTRLIKKVRKKIMVLELDSLALLTLEVNRYRVDHPLANRLT